MITRVNPLHPTIQSSVAGEEISEGALYWIERGTFLIALALTLLCVPTEGAGKSPTHSNSIPELFLLALKQRLLHHLDYFFVIVIGLKRDINALIGVYKLYTIY